jgi:hypothetical protein
MIIWTKRATENELRKGAISGRGGWLITTANWTTNRRYDTITVDL